jgi:hypothetical protein
LPLFKAIETHGGWKFEFQELQDAGRLRHQASSKLSARQRPHLNIISKWLPTKIRILRLRDCELRSSAGLAAWLSAQVWIVQTEHLKAAQGSWRQ